MTWLISDLHFGHKNIIGYTDRPFASVEEMDEEMIKRWNEVVEPRDIVNVLGDFSFYNRERTQDICDRLKGRKILIRGNHDDAHSNTWFFGCGFESVMDKCYIPTRLGPVELNHFHAYAGDTQLLFHGHAHNFFKAKHYVTNERILLNFSVECWNYTPVLIDNALLTVERIKQAFHEKGTTTFKVGEI